ncbi:primosomal protein N' [Thalassotalea ganghwensis]
MVRELYIQVAIPVPMRQIFTYLLPAGIDENLLTSGQRVTVPFSHRTVVGVILSITNVLPENVDKNKIKAIISVDTSGSRLPDDLVKLLKTAANYYQHPIGEVFQIALPVLLRQLQATELPAITKWFALKADQDSTLEQLAKKAPKQLQLYQQLDLDHGITWCELRALGYSKQQLNSLAKKRLAQEKESKSQPYLWSHGLNERDKHNLSTEQAIIVSAINQTLGQFACHLIDGVTGSGKTEVYLQAMESALLNNQQVLVLVPEIGLTPQTLQRFEQRFNVPIFLHHSGLNDKERLLTWQQSNDGQAAIVIGTRSAIFSPLQKLALIVVDEEHDASFKQQDSFRYNARDVAILRARQLNIPIVLGSATPSFESLHNAKVGKYHYHQLKKRAGNSVKSSISLIDTSTLKLNQGLSKPLIDAIATTLKRNEQVLVFLNRRGFAPAINCQECHWLAHCQRCNRPYTFHKQQGLLICHHCAGQKRVPPQCPDCGSIRVTPLGQGTEQIEQVVQQLFPQYSVVRIDRDTTRRKGELSKVLTQVSNKEHHILVGTQMLAKGHHFPDVTLVVMLDIDGALFSYDYRASEHMAQLLTQVAGRAGRASKPGKVLVQTQYPQHPLLQDLVHNGYQHFASQAMLERQYAHLPPYGFQALFRAEANFPSYPEHFLRAISQGLPSSCDFAGPMPAPAEKRAGKYRFHLLLQAKQRSDLHQAIQIVLQHIPKNEWHNKVRWSLDIDPIDLSW